MYKFKDKFKDRFKSLRTDFELTQQDLGYILKVSQRTISNYELGERFPDEILLNAIADYFDVTIDFLLGRTNIKNIYKK